jgi:hypothetical protein
MMSEKKSDQVWLTEELFLNAAVPVLRREMRKRMWKCCYGCKNGSLGQMAHDCINNYEVVVGALLPESTIFLEVKRRKVLRRMNELLSKDNISGKQEYGSITALDILEFLAPTDDDDAFKRITMERSLQRRLKQKVLDDSENAYPGGELPVKKRPRFAFDSWIGAGDFIG